MPSPRFMHTPVEVHPGAVHVMAASALKGVETARTAASPTAAMIFFFMCPHFRTIPARIQDTNQKYT
ncbi:hypothetical protein DOE76_00135 [Leifsonia sp. ku-ls]|nr:hypothetical protein DOE76_00135 [Leifsonia sp. ku-ls]